LRPGPIVADQLVAELNLGFWVSLLGRGSNYETRLWRPALRWAFPGYSGTRQVLHRELDHLRTFRNRIAHYEAIYHRHLEADHQSVLRVIGHISPDVATWVAHNDRVTEVLARRVGVCRGVLPTRF